jgi:hypothetical protein
MSRRESFTDRRRRLLARRSAALEQFERRDMVTEALWSLGVGLQVAAALAPHRTATADVADWAAQPRRAGWVSARTPAVIPLPRQAVSSPGGGGRETPAPAARPAPAADGTEADWLTLSAVSDNPQAPTVARLAGSGIAAPKQSGGGALPPRGGAGAPARGAITPLRFPPPTPSGSGNSAANASVGVAAASALGAGGRGGGGGGSTGTAPGVGASSAHLGAASVGPGPDATSTPANHALPQGLPLAPRRALATHPRPTG